MGFCGKLRIIWVAAILVIPIFTSVIHAAESVTLGYNLNPRQILTYQEITTNDILAPTNPYTICIDKTYTLSFLRAEKGKAWISLSVLSLNAKKIVSGNASPFVDALLQAPGSETRYVINRQGLVVSSGNSDSTMPIEGLPSHPVALNEGWETIESDGTMKSRYTLRKITQRGTLTYFLIQGRHQAKTVEDQTESGVKIHSVTEVTGDSWVYYVAEWGQVVSRDFTGDAVRCDTVSRPEGPVMRVTNIKVKKALRLVKILH